MPLKYPQIKGIYYFNVYKGDLTPTNNYALFENKTMNKKYNELLKNSIYVSNINENATFRYAEVKNDEVITIKDKSKIELSVYTIVPKVLEPKVEYILNGKVIHGIKSIPYSYDLDISDLNNENNKLEIKVYDDKGDLLKTKEYNIVKLKDKVEIELNK